MKIYCKDSELEYIARSIYCGCHSGIKMCCLKFFLEDWSYGLKLSRGYEYRHIMDMSNKKRKASGKPQRYYIPCPECLKNDSWIELKRCDCLKTKEKINVQK